MQTFNISSTYLEKQRNFRTLVKDIQISVKSKEYLKQGCPFNKYVKMKWNISQAQAYRYLLCAKVLDQLEEFEIQPSYERVCHALYHTTKTPAQMKLLWSVIIQKAGSVPESINSTHIKKIWKELCADEKYSSICQNNNSKETLNKKIENSLNKFSNSKMQKQMKSVITPQSLQSVQSVQSVQSTQTNQPINQTTMMSYSYVPTQAPTKPMINEQIKTNQLYSGNSMSSINMPLTPENNEYCSSVVYDGASSVSYSSLESTIVPQTNAPNNVYYMMQPNEIQYQPQQMVYYY